MDFSPASKMCSFCGTQGDQDTKFAGGLGAMMCGDCLNYYHEVFASEDKSDAISRPPWDEMSDPEVLSILPEIIKSADQAHAFAADWIEMLRARKISWAAIGKSLGVSRQAVWAKYGRRDGSTSDQSVEAG